MVQSLDVLFQSSLMPRASTNQGPFRSEQQSGTFAAGVRPLAILAAGGAGEKITQICSFWGIFLEFAHRFVLVIW